MLFFGSKDVVSKTTVKIHAVYKHKKDGAIVVVCGISRPANKHAIMDGTLHGKLSITLDNCSNTIGLYNGKHEYSATEFIHNKQTATGTVVVLKPCVDFYRGASAMLLSEFLNNYELVIGYDSSNNVIVESDLAKY